MSENKDALPTRPLTPREAAQFLSVSPRTLSRLVKRGDLPVYKVGGSLRYKLSDLTALVDRSLVIGND